MRMRQLLVLAMSVAISCTLVSEVAGADPLVARGLARGLRPYPFRPEDGPPFVMVVRGGYTWLGDYDKNGNFLPDPRCAPNLGCSGSGLPRFVADFGGPMLGYEYRSGRLIKGTQLGNPSNDFVPEIGSTVLSVKDVNLKKPDRYVRGLLKARDAYLAERKQKYGDKPPPKAPLPPEAGTPPGFEFKLYRELAYDKKPPSVARVIGRIMEFGWLSDSGSFIPDRKLPVLPRVEIFYPQTPAYAANQFQFRYTLPRWKSDQKGRPETEEVYEYRSGRLITGTLQKSGNFVPELGSKILDFKEYNPLLDNRRIYNLPGVLQPVKK